MKPRKLSASRYQDAFDDKDKGGAGRKGVIDWKKISPAVSFYEAKIGKGSFHILPFEVKSKNHPLVSQGKMKIGDLDFCLDVWVHRYIGPTKADIVCLKKNYGRHCPICDESSKYYDQGKKEEGKSLRASRRIFLNVLPEDADTSLVFEVSHYLFMKELLEEAHECADGKDIIPFVDLEEGKLIGFRAAEGELEKTIEFKSFRFIDRKPLPESWLEKVVSFDEFLDVTPADKMEKILFGQDEEEVPEPKKETATRSKVKEEDEEEEEAAPPKKSGSSGKVCPSGFKWGDEGQHKECKKCAVWESCADAS